MAKTSLEADRAEIEQFVDATFRYADEGAAVCLRNFAEGSNDVLKTVRVPVKDGGFSAIVDNASYLAGKAANAIRPAVFAPPVATFIGNRARERDLGNGLVLTVEADTSPSIARRNLEALIGLPTIVVASGGEWADPDTGEVQEKLHLHWRSCEPSRSKEEHERLKHARRLACELVGADKTAITLVHPLRWPGSWHRKGEPRMARIVDCRPDVEIDSEEVIDQLEPLVGLRRQIGRRGSRAASPSQLNEQDLAALGEIIANPDLEWADWNRLGLAFFAASGGSDAGLEAFEAISRKSAKHDSDVSRGRWDHYRTSPPDRLGPGTLIYEARRIESSFRLPSWRSRQSTSGSAIGNTAENPDAAFNVTPREWHGRLLCNDKGVPRDCVANAVHVLRLDPGFIDRLRFDELHQAAFASDLPWRAGQVWQSWGDVDDTELANWCQLHGVVLKPTTCAAAVELVASHHRHHAVRDYLDSLEWDRTPRLDTWLENYVGARIDAETLDAEVSDDDLNREELTPSERYGVYLRSIGPKWLIAAVARIYSPGCKVDHVIIFEGHQGIGKSTALRILAGNEWFADEIADLGSKDSAQDLRGKWIVELGEVAALRRASVERMKAFISRNVDHYRPSYGRRSMDFPRQCVFAGTTNADTYLADETGNRRFWPVKVFALQLDALQQDRDQLWAEAVVRFKAGEPWWLDRELETVAAGEQEQRRQNDPWEEPILDWLSRQTSTDHTVAGILIGALGRQIEDWTQADLNRVARCLRGNGYERIQVRDPTKRDAQGKGRRFWIYRLCHQ